MEPKTELSSNDQNANLEAPLVSSYNDKIRPVLDAVDKLRNLRVVEEGIQLPTIVVVGDQSSGKSSVLESLAGISLPRGQGICTRVPLVMRIQNHSNPNPELVLEFKGKLIQTDEKNVSDAIELATNEVAGSGKGISDIPLTLTVKKKGVPDLTMVDLPGITRVPVHGQPDNIYDEIRDIIIEYIEPEESIILNVLSATVDFPTCESIRMSQSVDKTGERTLAVVTKSDKSPEGLLEKVTSDDVNIGLGYVCVRNRIGEESYEEARAVEAKLFASHPLLSKIDKSIVGVPVLAQTLMQIQAKSIARNLPEIRKKIDETLNNSRSELKKLPNTVAFSSEATVAFTGIVMLAKMSLDKILISGEFDEFPNEDRLHCSAQLARMLGNFATKLRSSPHSSGAHNFLLDEIRHLEKAEKIALPSFLPRMAFNAILREKVAGVEGIPMSFVGEFWDYIVEAVTTVVERRAEGYPELKKVVRRAAHNSAAKLREQSEMWVAEMVEMEKLSDYTCDPEYSIVSNKLVANQKANFIATVGARNVSVMQLDGVGKVGLGNLRPYVNSHRLSDAFELGMRIVAYWEIVLKRFVDYMGLHLQLSVHRLVNYELEAELMKEVLLVENGYTVLKLMEESPGMAAKRQRLSGSIKKMEDCKEILAQIIDKIGG